MKSTGEQSRQNSRPPWDHTYEELLQKFPTGKTPRDAQKEALQRLNEGFTNGKRFVLVEMATGGGKCVKTDTPIFTRDGIISIDTFKALNPTPSVHSLRLTGSSHQPRAPINYVEYKNQPTIKMSTRTGLTLEATRNHRIVVANSNQLNWKRMDELRIGDWVPLNRVQTTCSQTLVRLRLPKRLSHPSHHAIELPGTLDTQTAFLMGLWVAEGNYGPNVVDITTADDDVAAMAELVWLEKFKGVRVFRHPKKESLAFTLVACGSEVVEFLKLNGLTGLAKNKSIPQCILSSPREVQHSFLRGLYSGDGFVEHSSVHYLTASHVMATQLQTLLLYNGMISTLTIKCKHDQNGRKGTYYELAISASNLEGFKKIGFVNVKRQTRFQRLLTKNRNTNIDVVPLPGALMAVYKSYVKETRRHVLPQCVVKDGIGSVATLAIRGVNRSVLGAYLYEARRPSYEQLERFLKAMPEASNTPEYKLLLNLCQTRPFFTQITALDKGVADVADIQVPILHAYTANGFISHNSFIAKAAADVVAKDGGAFMITAQKALQDQYEHDFPAPQIEILKGRANYPCTHAEATVSMHAGKAVCHQNNKAILLACIDALGAEPYLEEDEEGNVESPLAAATQLRLPPELHYCPYWKQLQKCNDSKLTLFNFSSFLFQRRMKRFQHRALMLIDEGHNIESQLMNFVTVELTGWALSIIGVTIDREITRKDQFIDWLLEKNVVRLIDSQLRMLDEGGSSKDADLRQMEKVELLSLQDKLKIFMSNLDRTEWILETIDYKTRRGDPTRKIMARPLYAKVFAEELLFRHADRVVIFSATILNMALWAKNLGIDPSEVEHIVTPCEFPSENRPLHLEFVGNMGAKHFSPKRNPDNPTQPKFVAKIKQLLDRHAGQRGVIHSHSFALTNVLRDDVASPRFLFQADFGGDKQLMMSALASVDDAVIVAPAMHEGFDFRGSLARFQIIAKVPWPDLGDKIVSERANRDDNFYGWLTCLKIVQSYGRIVRSKNDWGYCYIIDSGFKYFFSKHGRMLPPWFKDAISRYAPRGAIRRD